MTVIRPNSISGVTSITAHTQSIEFYKSDGTLSGANLDGININTAGILTASTFVGNLTGNVTGNISGGTVAGSTGTFTGDVDIADTIKHTGDTDTKIRFPGADTISFETNGSEVARITTSAVQGGQVRIGNPNNLGAWGQTNRLQVAGSDWNTSGVTIAKMGGNATAPNLVFGASRGATPGTAIQNGDRLGYISFTGDDGTDLYNVGAAIVSGTDAAPSSNSIKGTLQFYTGGNSTERLRIDSTGRTLVSGTFGFGNLPLGGNAANAALQIRCQSQYQGIAFGESATNATIGRGANNGALIYTANANPANLGGGTKVTHEWHSGSAGGGGPGRYMALDTDGDLTLDYGSLKVASGQGIDFSATSGGSGGSSEILTDYEQGTFTATLTTSGGGASFGGGHIQTACLYIKIGSMVHIQGYFSGVNITGGGTGIAKVTGLPFASNNTTYYTICITHNTVTSNTCAGAYIQYSNTYFFPIVTNGTTGSALNVGNPRYMMFGGSYPVQY